MPRAFILSSDMLLGLSQPVLLSGWHTKPVPRSQLPGQLTHWHRPWAHRLLLIHSPEGDRMWGRMAGFPPCCSLAAEAQWVGTKMTEQAPAWESRVPGCCLRWGGFAPLHVRAEGQGPPEGHQERGEGVGNCLLPKDSTNKKLPELP